MGHAWRFFGCLRHLGLEKLARTIVVIPRVAYLSIGR